MNPLIQTLSLWSRYEVHTLSWLEAHGLSQTQAFRSYQAGELRKIGAGIYVRHGDPLHWAGAIQAIQKELGLSIHVAGVSALELQGAGHNATSKKWHLILTTYASANIPKWLKANDWGVEFQFHRSSLFEQNRWLDTYQQDGLDIKLACRELAILEYIDQSDYEHSFGPTENYMLGLITMRPKVLQELLEECRSVKVKRIFLYLSEKMGMPYFQDLDIRKIDLGSGKRVVIKQGRFDHKYKITVERQDEESEF